jgi:nicotinamidase-related amidase
MDNIAVVVIDMLNDFVTGKLKCERAERIIPNLKKLIQVARENNIPVIYSNDAHNKEDFEVVNIWGEHGMKGTNGAEVIPELRPAPQDFIIEKRTYSGFFETGLDSLLRSLYDGKGVHTLILGGLHANMCVRHTSADATYRGYKIIVPSDCVEAFTQKDYEDGLRDLSGHYKAKIVKSVDDIIREYNL